MINFEVLFNWQMSIFALMLELVDSHASEACVRKGVGVQISLRAQYFADMAELVYAHA